jgi:hypothetical protein
VEAGINQKRQIKAVLKSLKHRLENGNLSMEVSMSELDDVAGELLSQFEYPKGRRNLYVWLKESLLDYELGDIAEETHMLHLFEVLSTDTRYRVSGESHDVLLNYGKSLCGDNVYDNPKKHREFYKKIAELLADNPKTQGVRLEKQQVQAVTQDLLDYMIRVDAQTFLYDAGYPMNRKTDVSVAMTRKRDKTLEILEAYCKEKRISLQQSGNVPEDDRYEFLSEAKKQDCEILYEKLKAEKQYEDVFIPVAIDRDTGAGIYIVGKEYYKSDDSFCKRKLYDSIEGSCCYSILYNVDLVDMKTYSYDGSTIVANVTYSISDCWEITNFPNIREAEIWLLRFKQKGMFLNECNGVVPEGCPQRFLKYFEKEEEEDILEEEKRKIREQLAQEKKIYDEIGVQEERKCYQSRMKGR